MAYPLMEHPLGEKFFFNGECFGLSSSLASELMKSTDECTYYETVRVVNGVLLFVEDHMDRLGRSVAGLENFPLDTNSIIKDAYSFINECGVKKGNIRIVLTKTKLLIHEVGVRMPEAVNFEQGINTMLLNWERQTPNLKIFRGDYKTAVNNTFAKKNTHGVPFELVLTDNAGRLYEGSMSNLFVIKDGTVYSAPDDKILIGITRRRVIEALKRSGLSLHIGMFTIDELLHSKDTALFVSSTPFDILPIAHIDEYSFDSASNPIQKMIADEYRKYTQEYLLKR